MTVPVAPTGEDFPGYQAGASLKRRSRARVRDRTRYFPGYQAGASLKRVSLLWSGAISPGLPRLPSRGLIEARRDDSHALMTHSDFPGYQAGASLKQAALGGVVEISKHFPGYQAGASLKHPVATVRAHAVLDTSPVTKPGPH